MGARHFAKPKPKQVPLFKGLSVLCYMGSLAGLGFSAYETYLRYMATMKFSMAMGQFLEAKGERVTPKDMMMVATKARGLYDTLSGNS